MRKALLGLGIVMIAVGGVWTLQGIGLLGGSFMTGTLLSHCTRWRTKVLGTYHRIVERVNATARNAEVPLP